MSTSFEASSKAHTFAGIGPLEARILAIVWEHDPQAIRVREVYERLLTERQIAYTTVMTVMGNLTKKGLLERDQSKATYLYRAAIPAEQVGGEVLRSVIEAFFRGRSGAALTRLLGLEGEFNQEQLEKLRDYGRGLIATRGDGAKGA